MNFEKRNVFNPVNVSCSLKINNFGEFMKSSIRNILSDQNDSIHLESMSEDQQSLFSNFYINNKSPYYNAHKNPANTYFGENNVDSKNSISFDKNTIPKRKEAAKVFSLEKIGTLGKMTISKFT